jgi:hypothetical protein
MEIQRGLTPLEAGGLVLDLLYELAMLHLVCGQP